MSAMKHEITVGHTNGVAYGQCSCERVMWSEEAAIHHLAEAEVADKHKLKKTKAVGIDGYCSAEGPSFLLDREDMENHRFEEVQALLGKNERYQEIRRNKEAKRGREIKSLTSQGYTEQSARAYAEGLISKQELRKEGG